VTAPAEEDIPLLTEVVEETTPAANEAAPANAPAPVEPSGGAPADPIGLEALAQQLEKEIVARLTPQLTRLTAQAVREALAAAVAPLPAEPPKE
jgi:hypothetical protein